MKFQINITSSILSLQADESEINLFVSKEIDAKDMHHSSLNHIASWSPNNRGSLKVTEYKTGWKLTTSKKSWRKWLLKFKSLPLILPTREGEYVSSPNNFGNYHIYSLSYPGTASSKCVVMFTGKNSGLVVCSEPNFNWAKISLSRLENDFILQILQEDQDLYIFPFENDWKVAVSSFSKSLVPQSHKTPKHKILNSPRFLLQMGVRDFFGNSQITKFTDLIPLISRYRKMLGPNNIVHLFGTNSHGFDNYFPNFDIDAKLGGINNFKSLIKSIHNMDLLVSHHYNPRIADARWINENPEYREAAASNPSGNPWLEFYKNNIYYVMDPNNEKWLNLCVKKVSYFKDLEVDYVEIDQIAYQRNLYTNNGGFGHGYQKLLDMVKKLDQKYWVEGVSDVFDLPKDCYFQVLPRDRKQLWETGENRRGYVHGTQMTLFYKTLMPHAPISYQIVTEKARLNLISRRMHLAQKYNANVYDLELGFVDKNYKRRFEKTMKRISRIMKEKKPNDK